MIVHSDLLSAYTGLGAMARVAHIFVIGGAQIYREALRLHYSNKHVRALLSTIHLTRVGLPHESAIAATAKAAEGAIAATTSLSGCDAFFPELAEVEDERSGWRLRRAESDGGPLLDQKSGLAYEFLQCVLFFCRIFFSLLRLRSLAFFTPPNCFLPPVLALS